LKKPAYDELPRRQCKFAAEEMKVQVVAD